MDDEIRQRLRWIKLYEQTGDAGLVCRRCGISRPTLRKWLRRYEQLGTAGPKSQSRRPKHSPGRKALAQQEQWILDLRRDRNLGVRRIQNELKHLHECSALQAAQGDELLAGPGNTSFPTIYAGDFNSAAVGAVGGPDQTPTYGNLIAAGLVDLWSAANPKDPGFTWPLHGEDPYTQSTPPTERIDLVLGDGRVDAMSAQRIGTGDLTPSGLWPSDHAGIAATVLIR